ncbi:MAG: lipoyl domain-containing protein [Burkholderiales bacterium]|nr:lipoyl domain-containing protein [Burkholderiales bacterium]
MKVTLKLPMFGMNMEEATIVKWHKAPGEAFSKGEPLYDIETEKVTSEIEAPCAGTLLEVVAASGREVKVGDAVCVVDASA